jgi:hypothetical protein
MKSAGGEGAAALRLLTHKYPEKEMQLHRLYRGNDEFRSLCDDYLAAVKASEFWGTAGNTCRAEEYRLLADELQSLVLETLG